MLTRSGGAPTRVLLLVTALLALAGGVLLGLGLSGAPQPAGDAFEPLGPDATVQVGDDGFSLWSLEADAYASALCTADGTPLLRPVTPYSVTAGGTQYHEVARSPRALQAGSYAVSCTPEQALYAGPHAEQTVPPVVRGPVGVLAGAALLALALLTGVVTFVAHRRRKQLEGWRVPAHRLDPRLRSQEETGEPAREEASGPAREETGGPDEAPERRRRRRASRPGAAT